MVDKKAINHIAAIVALGASGIFLQTVAFAKFGLDSSRLLSPQWLIDNAISMKDVGLVVSFLATIILYAYSSTGFTKGTKLLFSLVGIVFLATGAKILTSGTIISYDSLIGLIFVVVGINMGLKMINRKLF